MDRQRIILIVEDHEPTRRALARLFAMRGYEVHVASTITEGLKLLAVDPDCLVLDLMLPDGEGEDVLRRVRRTGSRAKVAVASGTGDERRLEAVRKLSPDALLRKPICPRDIDRICELVHGSN